ncbi:MAG: hypothetical protein QOE20_416 [Mycobacterium sp.]|nr:hypothetical protein [Mycobacterium sp.]
MLEVIDKGHVTEAHPSPLLFVHGGCHAAWCWDEHFLDYFASHGFRAAAVSFRAHGGSDSDKPLNRLSVADYVDDVRTAAEGLDGHPIVVGHSLGGFTVQHYLQRYDAPAGVLLASLPPQGVLRCALRLWRKHPLITMRANTFGETRKSSRDVRARCCFATTRRKPSSTQARPAARTRAGAPLSSTRASGCPKPLECPRRCWCSAVRTTEASPTPK